MPQLTTLPDACCVKRSQARDIADGLSRVIGRAGMTRIWLYIAPNGDVGFGIGGPMDGVGDLSLCGVYTVETSARQIEEDILAMERERIA